MNSSAADGSARRGETASGEVERKVREAAGDGLSRAADAALRAGHWAERKGGTASRIVPPARKTWGSLSEAAEYVRIRELDGMKADLETEVDRHPIRSLLMAAGAGFLFGKILR